AQSSYRQVVTRLALRGEPVRRFMTPNPITVPAPLDLRAWVDEYVYRHHHKSFPVTVEGRLAGVIHTGALARFPRAEWHLHTVGEVMRRDVDALSLPPDANALQALDRMRRTGSSRLLVTEGDRLVGVISLKDLAHFLRLKSELEGFEDETPARPT